MPDYCENKLYVTGDNHVISAFHQDIQRQYAQMHKKPNSDNKRSKGKCTYWNKDRGYGFIIDEEDEIHDMFGDGTDNYGDIFVHYSDVHANGEKILGCEEYVEFDMITQRDGRKKAINVTGPNGRYVRGNYGYNNLKTSYDVNLECCGLKFEKIDLKQNSIKISKNKPNLTQESINCIEKCIICQFSSLFVPPLNWLRCMNKKYSKFNITFKLFYQCENPETYGCIMYENGEKTKDYSIEQYELFQQNYNEFDKIIREELQNIFSSVVKKNLFHYIECNEIQNEILNFCGQYFPSEGNEMYRKFMEEWEGYKEDKNYHIQQDSIFFDVFNNVEKKINSIFVHHEIEIIEKWSVKYYFWEEQDGTFSQLIDKVSKQTF